MTAAASVTMENTISERSATARGVSAQRMPAAIRSSALSRERFQPVTACPAFIRRGTINCPIAPRPTNPMSMRGPQRVARRNCIGFSGDGEQPDTQVAARGQRGALRGRCPPSPRASRGGWDASGVSGAIVRSSAGRIPAAATSSLHHELDPLARLERFALLEAIEGQEALERPVAGRHALRQAFGGVARRDGDDLEAKRLRRVDLVERQAAERPDRLAERRSLSALAGFAAKMKR